MSVAVWLAMALVGGAGAVARLQLDERVQEHTAGRFPYGTLTVNVSGSLVLGLLTGAGVTGEALFIAGTGFLGSFTTFSTWLLESERLGEEGDERLGILNLGVSFAAGLAAAALGWAIGASL
jgi:CrcB protein